MKRIGVSLVVLLLAACGGRVATSPAPAEVRSGIIAALEASTQEWNRGNLEGFILPYADSATYVGSSGLVRGKHQLRETYRRSYWRTGRPAQTLRFEGIEVRPLGPNHALAVGRYVLTGGDRPQSGWFSLAWVRTPAGWRIIHDHSS